MYPVVRRIPHRQSRESAPVLLVEQSCESVVLMAVKCAKMAVSQYKMPQNVTTLLTN